MPRLFFAPTNPAAGRRLQTPQLPPYPMLTLPLSTITGTERPPFENFNISSRRVLSFRTSWYWTS